MSSPNHKRSRGEESATSTILARGKESTTPTVHDILDDWYEWHVEHMVPKFNLDWITADSRDSELMWFGEELEAQQDLNSPLIAYLAFRSQPLPKFSSFRAILSDQNACTSMTEYMKAATLRIKVNNEIEAGLQYPDDDNYSAFKTLYDERGLNSQ